MDYLINYYFNIETSIFISFIISLIYFYRYKKIIIISFLLIILYDLLFSRILFIYLTSFYLIYNIYLLVKKNNYLNYLMILIFSNIIIYVVKYLALYLLNINNIYIYELLINLFINTIITILLSFILYLIFKKIKLRIV